MLAFTSLAPMQQFGIITALTISYSLTAAVLVEPARLKLWAQYRALKDPPAPSADAAAVRTSQPVA